MTTNSSAAHGHVQPEQPDEVAFVEAVALAGERQHEGQHQRGAEHGNAGHQPDPARVAVHANRGASAVTPSIDTQAALDAQHPLGLAAQAELHGAGQLRAVEPVAELQVVARFGVQLRQFGQLPARRCATPRSAPRPAVWKLWLQAAEADAPGGRQRLVGHAPAALHPGDALVAPVPAIAVAARPRRRSTPARRAAARLPRSWAASGGRRSRASARRPGAAAAAGPARRLARAPSRCPAGQAAARAPGPAASFGGPASGRIAGCVRRYVRSCGSGPGRSRRAAPRLRRHRLDCRAPSADVRARPGAAPPPLAPWRCKNASICAWPSHLKIEQVA